jgi:dTDP-4-amino-4,6-dideoxygalactose transaminase
MNNPIYVTKPSLPPLEDLLPYLQEIWDNRILTNSGPFHQQLEAELCRYLNVKYISLFSNATLALITALKALRITGEVITTPYSFVATTHSLDWNGIKPVFIDIDPRTLNIDPSKIEEAITPATTAIMAVHCYGIPCDVDAIERIAQKHNLRVIYDAAHAFGVTCHCESLLTHGDLSILSFHATKVFNTFEGGAIVSGDPSMKERIDQLKNFGFVDEVTLSATGINAKMSEFNAALGLLQLKHIDDELTKRSIIAKKYISELSNVAGINCLYDGQLSTNFSYFPILVDNQHKSSRDAIYNRLKENKVYARRYFYPLISDFPMYRNLTSSSKINLPVANRASNEILCLPIYGSLPMSDQDRIISIVLEDS